MKYEYPIHLDIESTNYCQLACPMCPHPKMKRPKGYMEWDIFKKIIDESKGKAKTSYLHQIGEPLLHKDIIRRINYTAEAGIRASISTNCMALNNKMADKIIDSKLTELTIGIDAVEKSIYEKIRKNSDFYKVMCNIGNFISRLKTAQTDLILDIQIIENIYNKDSLEESRDFWCSRVKGVKNAQVRIKKYSTFAGTVDNLGLEQQALRFKCAKVWKTITINWDGSIVICCRDYDHFTKVGNIQDVSIEEIYNSQIYADLRQGFREKKFPEFCRNC